MVDIIKEEQLQEEQNKTTRGVRRRAYNAWRKFKKKLEDQTRKQLGSNYNQLQFEVSFQKEWPNPMNAGQYTIDKSYEAKTQQVIKLLMDASRPKDA